MNRSIENKRLFFKKKVTRARYGCICFNSRTWEAEAGQSLNARPAWSTQGAQDDQGFLVNPV